MKNRTELAKYFNELGFRIGVEIGVARGEYAQELLDSNPDLHLILIDPWRYWGTGYIDPENSPQSEQDEKYLFVRQRFVDKKVVIWRATSMAAAVCMPEECLDFVYIDANHAYDWIMADILVWWQKVRKGGILAGHDFGYVQDAVRDFEKYSQVELNLCENEQDWFFRKGT